MKAMQIMSFILLFYMSFYLLSLTGIFFFTPELESESNFTAILSISLFAGFTVAAAVGIGLSRYGVNPYLTTAHLAFYSFYTGMSVALMTLLTLIGAMIGEEFVYIMGGISVVIGAILIFTVFYSYIQFSVGGGKGFE